MPLMDDLSNLLSPNQISRNHSILEQHSHDESYHKPVLPDVVVFPESPKDVVKVLQYANTNRVPVVPFGAGSALEGHVVPVQGGISLDMMRMNRILEIRPDDFLVQVQPGVTRVQLNEALKRYGLFFPVDPGADASLGGMAATNASGTTTVRYGAMKDNVRALEVVLADGRIIQAGSLAAKSSSGYHLTELFVGSEGTLGVFTAIWLRVYGIPEKTIAARAEFPDIDSCVRAATVMMGAGLGLARIELVDEVAVEAFNRFKGTTYSVAPTLFLEFHGSQAGIAHEVSLALELSEDEGCANFVSVEDEKDRLQLWEVRHSALYAFMSQYPGYGHMSTDVCVPLSKLPEAVRNARDAVREMGLHGDIVGHVGDGNFHVGLAIEPDDETALEKALMFNGRVVKHALSVGGTCTGEHGVGLGKRHYQQQEHGPALAVMRSIKQVLDPQGILNPGKLVSES